MAFPRKRASLKPQIDCELADCSADDEGGINETACDKPEVKDKVLVKALKLGLKAALSPFQSRHDSEAHGCGNHDCGCKTAGNDSSAPIERAILAKLNDSAKRMGHCDPKWLHDGLDFPIETTEPGKNGPSMILLHGLFGALSNWDSILPHLSTFSEPIALRFPLLSGHRSEVRVKALALLTEYFIRKRKMGPTILCGNSLGGHVAMRLCLCSPELVDCLVLAGTSGLYEHSVDSLPIRPDEEFVREHMARVFYNQEFVTEEGISEIANILKDRANVLNIIHAARSAKRDNLLSLLKQIKVPTLLLWGEDDNVTTMDVAESFHKNIPNSKLVSIKNCGHAPMIEHPEWFSNEIEKFVKENSKQTSKK